MIEMGSSEKSHENGSGWYVKSRHVNENVPRTEHWRTSTFICKAKGKNIKKT